MSSRTFLLLSGEHPTLPYAEVKAILNSEGIEYVEEERGDQALVIHSRGSVNKVLGSRGALVMEGGELLGRSEHSAESLRRACENIDWSFLAGKSFGVRVNRVKRHWGGADIQSIEKAIGDAIPRGLGAKVDLESPQVWIRGVISDAYLYIFLQGFRTDRKAFVERRAKTRPYFHPGVLDPKLSRVFVNLSGIRAGELFLDPFCGTGGFLIEASMMGMRAVGIDNDRRMVRGALRNIRFYGLECDLICGDATSMPLTRADGIATDPPYGRGTSTGGERVEDLISGLLKNAWRLLKKGKRICFASPSEIKPSSIAEGEGFKVLEVHSMRVHKSLTRAIVVAERG